ncbi:hypothetical protein LBMAG42_49340 [Deltaproteobacteria bacterium]|nr:hypothetical protein LBMAG42_49340 [Deltaproteobacteria bacterium]
MVEGPDRDALLGSLREVLGALGGLPAGAVEVHTLDSLSEPDIPVVRVVTGGRGDDDGPAFGPRADLRLAEEDSSDPDSESVDVDGAYGESLPEQLDATLRMVRLARRHRDDPLPDPPGQIRLSPVDGHEAVQTVFVGSQRRTYRLRCVSGVLLVEADTRRVGRLTPGQTVDVEARQLQVAATEPSEGRYIRLRT